MSYQAIKDALEAGPTEGPWWLRYADELPDCPHAWILEGGYGHGKAGRHIANFPKLVEDARGRQSVDAKFIAECNPTAIRALLAELEEAKSALATIASFKPEDHDETSDEWGEAWAFGQCREIAAAAIGKEQSK